VTKIYKQIKSLGGEVLVVSFAPPPKVAAYLARKCLPFPVVSDPTLDAYRAFALGRTSWLEIVNPAVLWRFVKIVLRGWLPRKPDKDEDLLQLGGDFVVDRARRIVYAHPSREPTDRPTNAKLLEAVRAAQPRA
jgi:AhpC/TSA antioxidant enzyme